MTITEFLSSQYMITRGHESVNLAAYVYPPSLGTREILVEKSLEKMAIKWCKVIKSDLYRNMSDDAKAKSFKYLDKIKDQVEITRPWTPNKLDAKYSEAEIDQSGQKRGQKRSKNSMSSNTYASAVKSNSGSPVQVINAANPSSHTITSTITHDVDSDTVKELKQQILKLEVMVQAATTNNSASTNNNSTTSDIANDTIKELKDHIEKLQERQDKTEAQITTIESVTKSTNNAVTETKQALVDTNKVIEQNKIDFLKIMLRMEDSKRVAQEIAAKQFKDLQETLLKMGTVGKAAPNDENKMDVDPKLTDTPGGNHSNCDGRSAFGSLSNF
jgi:hypothetical protein